LGYQKVFNTGENKIDLGYVPGKYNTTGGFYLPINSEVSSANLEFKYTLEDYISPLITELNRPEWHPEAPFDYDPEMCIFQERLYVAYRSYSWRDANQSDADIVINSTADGITWQDSTIEITKAPDTEVPYIGGKRSGDFYPSLAVFKNKLYCAWESDSPLPLGSTHDEDRDILWTSFDGNTWQEPNELTAPTDQAAEDSYSKNPGIKDDYRVQLCTFNNGSSEQLFAIWTANNTGDEKFPEDRKGDIVISRTTDGDYWSTGFDLSANDKRYDEDFLPQLVEFETSMGNALFAFWVTNNELLTNGGDWDIVYRFTFDGTTWSDTYNLIDAIGATESDYTTNAVDDDLSVAVYNNGLYVLWRTSNHLITNGMDIDIVMAHTSDGFNWSAPVEITSNSDSAFNNKPKIVEYNNKLVFMYIVWRTVDTEQRGSIYLRVFDNDLKQWFDPIPFSIQDQEVNDFSPDIITHNNIVMLSWVSQDNITTPGIDSDVVVRGFVPQNGAPEMALNIGDDSEFNDEWLLKKQELVEGKTVKIDFTGKLQQLFNEKDMIKKYKINDEFENEMYLVPISVYFSDPGLITLDSLKIQYNYSILVPDMGEKLAKFIKTNKDDSNDGDVQVPLRFESISSGKVRIMNLKVTYTTKSEPDQFAEVWCIMIFGIILIILGLFIKFSGPKRTRPKNKRQKNNV
jgi:hypothetical protein